jgi:hypothetical protein
MLLPKEYRAPELVYVVEAHDDRESHTQLGAFFNEHEARNCIARLEADGHTDLIINMIPVHLRVQDWEFDREAQGQKGTRLPVAGGAPTTRNALF